MCLMDAASGVPEHAVELDSQMVVTGTTISQLFTRGEDRRSSRTVLVGDKLDHSVRRQPGWAGVGACSRLTITPGGLHAVTFWSSKPCVFRAPGIARAQARLHLCSPQSSKTDRRAAPKQIDGRKIIDSGRFVAGTIRQPAPLSCAATALFQCVFGVCRALQS